MHGLFLHLGPENSCKIVFSVVSSATIRFFENVNEDKWRKTNFHRSTEKRARNRFFCGILNHDKCYSLLLGHGSVWAWIIYWCNIEPAVAKSTSAALSMLPVKSQRQKIFLQNIDINHLLRREFFLHKKQLSVPEMETSLSILAVKSVQKKRRNILPASVERFSKSDELNEMLEPWSVEIDCLLFFYQILLIEKICKKPEVT